MTAFKDIILKLRTEKGLSQEALASELGMSKSTVAMWETGKRFPSPDVYETLADYFNVDMDYIYGRTNLRQKIHFDNDGNAYYSNNETREIAQEILEKPELRSLFDVAKDIPPERLKAHIEFMKSLKESKK